MKNKTQISKWSKVILAGSALCVIGSTILLENAQAFPRNDHSGNPVQAGDKMQMELKSPVEMFSKILKQAVEEKLINQEQADKITDFLEKKESEKKTEFDKTKDSQPGKPKKFDGEPPKGKPDFLADVVKAGIITQKQADGIGKLMPQLPKDKPDFEPQGK